MMNKYVVDVHALDKILQTISLLGYLHEMKGITGPHMVVAPKSTLKNWMEQIKLICPVLRVAKFLDSSDKGLVTGEFDVCVTSFESVIKEKLAFRKFSWRCIIIDQVHQIKNENSILSQTMQKFKTNFRLLIIDTPLQNNVHELQSLIGFLLHEIFSSAEILGESDQQEKVVQQFHKVFRPFLLQRLESDIRNGVLEETILKVGMSQMQKQYYRAFLQKDKELINMALEQEDCVGTKWSIQRKRFLRTARQLLKCCNHPYLFAGAEFGCPYTTHEHLINTAGKMILLDKLPPLLKDSKVILFSQMRRQLDIIEDYFNFRDYKYCRLDGNIVGDDHASIKALNAPSEKLVFLLSSRAGLDINLTTADVLKAHRIGETKKVCVYRFCTKSTIEEKVIERAYKMIACPTIKQEQLLELMRVSRGDLLQMIILDVRELCSTMDTTITDEPIDKIFDNREQKPPVLVDDSVKIGKRAITGSAWRMM
ncbi:hypothetical protein OROGR_007000 [Orobanche gracilis]